MCILILSIQTNMLNIAFDLVDEYVGSMTCQLAEGIGQNE